MKVIASVKKRENTLNEGSKNFIIEPYYQLCEDGSYRKIINAINEFPNNGNSFFINKNADSNGNSKQMNKATNIFEKYDGRLIKVEIDTDNTLLNFKPDDPNSCKYGVNIYSLDELRSDEILEIIKIDETYTIDEIIENDFNRYIPVDNMPLNNRILLEVGDYIYGCFDYSTAERKNEINNVTQKRIRISACYNSNPINSINKYKKEDIECLMKTVPIGYAKRRFIVDKSELNAVNKIETLDFIDDKSLINICQRIMKENKKYNLTNQNIKLIKECIEEVGEDCLAFKDTKLKRLEKMQEVISENEEFRKSILNNFFETDSWINIAREYINENPLIIEKIVEETKIYKEKMVQVKIKNDELKNLKKEIEELNLKKNEISKNAIQDEKNIICKLSNERKNIESKITSLRNEKEELEKTVIGYKQLNKLKEEVSYQERRKTEIQDHIKQLKKEFQNINSNPKEALAKCLSDEITKDIFREVILSNNKRDEEKVLDKVKTQRCNSAKEIINIFKEKLEKAGRDYGEEDIINLIISLAQNFITVFAGEPGVGKTSLCEILAKCFGAYENRFAKISVERGWNSSKDLIGYYNPITKIIEKTNEDMYNCLKTVNNENENGENNLYVVLLDEANLSPIEHYWSSFMMLTDDCTRKSVNIGGNNEFKLTEATRFLATINYDHTTENLSDRFLDRAWVILMESPDIENLLDCSIPQNVSNLETLIDFEDVVKFFGKKEGELRPHLKNQLVEILKILASNNISISKRSINAIVNYCIVAQEYMSNENDSYLPLDYAISQKILPMLKGQNENFRNMLEKLKKVFDDAGLDKCKYIIEKMLKKGNEEYEYYQFFTR